MLQQTWGKSGLLTANMGYIRVCYNKHGVKQDLLQQTRTCYSKDDWIRTFYSKYDIDQDSSKQTWGRSGLVTAQGCLVGCARRLDYVPGMA